LKGSLGKRGKKEVDWEGREKKIVGGKTKTELPWQKNKWEGTLFGGLNVSGGEKRVSLLPKEGEKMKSVPLTAKEEKGE